MGVVRYSWTISDLHTADVVVIACHAPACRRKRPTELRGGNSPSSAARRKALQDEPAMRPRVRATVFLPVLLLFLILSTQLHAQENGVRHPLTFAELTYGDAIQAIVADGTGGFWFGGRRVPRHYPQRATRYRNRGLDSYATAVCSDA